MSVLYLKEKQRGSVSVKVKLVAEYLCKIKILNYYLLKACS
jgi:hypothetical protein